MFKLFCINEPDQADFSDLVATASRVFIAMSLIKQSLLVKSDDWTMWTDESSQNKIFVAMSQNKLYLYRLLLEKEEPYPNGQEPLRYDE